MSARSRAWLSSDVTDVTDATAAIEGVTSATAVRLATYAKTVRSRVLGPTGMTVSLHLTEGVLERQLSKGLHPGACLVVTLDAEPVADVTLGDAAPGRPMTPSTVVPWLSMTKVASALRVVMAWDSGALSLDDPVVRFLPAFAAGGKADVTVRHLLTHTAGLRGADAIETLPVWDDEVARICAEPQESGWRAGRDAGYSRRAGFQILAEVVRRALGDDRPWDRIVSEDVFVKLGMVDCTLSLDASTAVRLAPRTATYWATPPAHSQARPHLPIAVDNSVCLPGSSGRGPVEELPKLLEALYLGGGPLLSAPAAEAMTARQRCGVKDQTFGAVLDWGLGLIVDSKMHGRPMVPYGFGLHASPRTFGHGGSQSAALLCDPEVGLVAVLACTGMCGDAAHSRRVHEVFTALYDDLGLS